MVGRKFIQNILVILAFHRTVVEGQYPQDYSIYKNDVDYGSRDTEECKCVPYYLCEDGKINTDAGPVLVARLVILYLLLLLIFLYF